MRTFSISSLFIISASILLGVTIDQISITVGNQAITQTEITREIRLGSLLNNESPDYSVEGRRKAADRLIEQALIRREMTFGSYPEASPAQIDEVLASTEKAHGGQAAVKSALAGYLLTQDDLRHYLAWQLDLLKFIDLRFRPAVQVTNRDIERYYTKTFSSRGDKAPTLSEIRSQIEQRLTGERVDEQVDKWVAETRSHTAIRYLDKTLVPSPGDKPVPASPASAL